MERKIRIYLIARISRDAQKWNEFVSDQLCGKTEVFVPHKHNPWNLKHEEFPKEIFEEDLQAMKESDIGLVLPPYGKDCAWEIGWYSNSEKPLVVFVDRETEWLRDWMVKGGVDVAITHNRETYAHLLEDPMLKHKIIYIDEICKLEDEIVNIANNYKKGKEEEI